MATSTDSLPVTVPLKIQVEPDGSFSSRAAWDWITYKDGIMTVSDGTIVTSYTVSDGISITRPLSSERSDDVPASTAFAKTRHNVLIGSFAPKYQSAWTDYYAGRIEVDASKAFTVDAPNPAVILMGAMAARADRIASQQSDGEAGGQDE